MATETKLVTAEELFCMPEGDVRRELIDGRMEEAMPPGYDHNLVMGNLTGHLWAHVSQRQLGKVLPGDTGIILRRDPDTVRAPDICFISTDRLPPAGVRTGYIAIIPDLIVEIVSSSDTAVEVRAKTEEWLRAGATLVWTLYPNTKTVIVSRGLGTDHILYAADTLTGEPVLPDFSVSVGALFE
ncbi:MAG: Uma2 family endonuclease [Dehalococcoidia bacterium]